MAVQLTPNSPEQKGTRDIEPTPEIPRETTESPSQPKAVESAGRLKAPPPSPALPGSPAAPPEPVLAEIEHVLEENLAELYQNLPADLQPGFKAKGEEIARTVRDMIDSAKVRAGKILKLIREWLRTIPGVNRFFLEKEAAIKAQKIVMLAKERSQEPLK